MLIALSAFSIQQPTWADHAIAAGGCDPAGGENDRETRFVQDAFRTAGWKSEQLFGDKFTQANLLSALEPERFKDGEKLFISIRTHGDPGHQICFTNPTTGDRVYLPVSDLKAALDRLVQEKHVKVALADGACYGGGSIKALAGPGVCVMSSTYAGATSYGTSIGASIAARVAVAKNPSQANALFKRHPEQDLSVAALSKPDPELDGHPGLSAEEMFLAARAFRGYSSNPDNHRAAQISSDVGGSGESMSPELVLGLGFKNEEYNPYGEASSKHLHDAYSKDLFSANMACAQDNPFPAIDQITRSFENARDRERAEDIAKRLGFDSVADAYDQMKNYYNQRRANYLLWVKKSGELQNRIAEIASDETQQPVLSCIQTSRRIEALGELKKKCEFTSSAAYNCDPDSPIAGRTHAQQLEDLKERLSSNVQRLSSLRRQVDENPKLSASLARYEALDKDYRDVMARDISMTDSGQYMKMEKVFYEVKYLQQRIKHADDSKAKACSDYIF